MSPPLISCLLVTLATAERFAFLARAIRCYQQQTYSDRELVLISNGGEEAARSRIRAHVAALGDPGIRLFEIPGCLSLGAVRNESMRRAEGSIVCQWDDDDLHHPQRLQRQYEALVGADSRAVFLRENMHFFAVTRDLYLTNWHATELGCHPGTLMCWRSPEIVYPEAGAEAKLGEDTAFGRKLATAARITTLSGSPHLYVYVCHGSNTWPRDHHHMLKRELSISSGLLLRRETALCEGLRDIDFGPGAITVQGSNGAAFALDPRCSTEMSSQ